MTDWKPIETRPKFGKYLITDTHEVFVWNILPVLMTKYMTHWMPFPNPPKKQHRCENTNGMRCITNESGGLNLILSDLGHFGGCVDYVRQVDFCPFCGEKA